MNTLIVYATKHGSVRKCAERLKEKLTGAVELYDLESGKSVNPGLYDSVIIGGSIYAGRIQKSVSEFCVQNLNALSAKRTGLFICCMNGKSSGEELEAAFPQELVKAARAKDSFGGEFRFTDMNFMEKTIVRMISKMEAKENKSQALDTKHDLSDIHTDRIDRFAEVMNNA